MSTRSPRLSETRRRVVEALQRLAEELNATVYLFGSMARGDHTLESDADVVVVSERFRGMPVPERIRLVRLMLPDDTGFDIVALTPEELERLRSRAFYRHISSHWIEVRPGQSQGKSRQHG